jgi:hypothetical protein
MFDSISHKALLVEHWGKRNLREETYRIQRILKKLDERKSAGLQQEKNGLDEQSRHLSGYRVVGKEVVDKLNAILETLLANMEPMSAKSLLPRRWRFGRLEISRPLANLRRISSFQKLGKGSGTILMSSTRATSELRYLPTLRLLDGAAQVRNIGLDNAVHHLVDVEHDQETAGQGIQGDQGLGAGFRERAGDISRT